MALRHTAAKHVVLQLFGWVFDVHISTFVVNRNCKIFEVCFMSIVHENHGVLLSRVFVETVQRDS